MDRNDAFKHAYKTYGDDLFHVAKDFLLTDSAAYKAIEEAFTQVWELGHEPTYLNLYSQVILVCVRKN